MAKKRGEHGKQRKRLTPTVLTERPPKSGRVEYRDTESKLRFRITATGARTFTVRTRLHDEQKRFSYPKAATIENLSDAKRWADSIVEKCAAGIDPKEEFRTEEERAKVAAERLEGNRVENIVESFLTLYASKNRTHFETKRVLQTYVLPSWRGRAMNEIRRSDVTALLDKIAARKVKHPETGKPVGGPVQVDRVLAHIRKLMNWHATRDDDYVSPIVRGMARTKPKERARTRTLTDDEIRALWKLTPQFEVFGAIVRALFLTAQRRGEVAGMLRSTIGDDGIWTIDPERYKTKIPQFVPLSTAALLHIGGQDQLDDADLVFTTNGKSEFSGFSKLKAQLDILMLAELKRAAMARGQDPEKVWLKPWVLHDIRRTAKTLMSRAGVRPDISERVLGHVIPGVEGTYDRHDYANEKRDALDRLALMLGRILYPSQQSNVVPLVAAQ